MRAVLFDLDDTVFDHKHSRLRGLAALQDRYQELRAVPLQELEREHEALLQADYARVLDGAITLAEGRVLRTQGLLSRYGLRVRTEEAGEAAAIYGYAYDVARHPVPGVTVLLEKLRPWARLGVVTNGLTAQQLEKLRVCRLEGMFGTVMVSEAFGARKPDPSIFKAALRALGARPEDTVFVGDSWNVDIAPARALGMRAVWLNRYGNPCPDPGLAVEIREFGDADLFL